MKTDTKTAILDAAEDLIKRYGSQGISYQDVSEIVKIRKPSIHHHFPTKGILISEVLTRASAEFFDRLDAIVASADDEPTKLKRFLGLFEETFTEGEGSHVCLYGMLAAESGTLDSDATSLLSGFIQKNLEFLKRLLDEGRASGTLAFNGGSETMGLTIISVLEGAMIVARVIDDVNAYKRTTRHLLRMLVPG